MVIQRSILEVNNTWPSFWRKMAGNGGKWRVFSELEDSAGFRRIPPPPADSRHFPPTIGPFNFSAETRQRPGGIWRLSADFRQYPPKIAKSRQSRHFPPKRTKNRRFSVLVRHDVYIIYAYVHLME